MFLTEVEGLGFSLLFQQFEDFDGKMTDCWLLAKAHKLLTTNALRIPRNVSIYP